MKTTLYLIRHGEYDQENNMNLTSSGVSQAHMLGELLSTKNIHHIISSPIQRVMKTAVPLAEKLKLHIEEDESFTEYYSDSDESFDEALERIRVGISRVVEKYTGESIAIFTHGFTVGEFLKLINYGTSENLPIGSVKAGAYAEVVCENGEYRVEEVYRIEKV